MGFDRKACEPESVSLVFTIRRFRLHGRGYSILAFRQLHSRIAILRLQPQFRHTSEFGRIRNLESITSKSLASDSPEEPHEERCDYAEAVVLTQQKCGTTRGKR